MAKLNWVVLERMTQRYLKNLPMPLLRLWRPMLLISLGLHGLLLIMLIPSPEKSSNSLEKQQELVSLIQLKPSPSPAVTVAPKPKATASTTPSRPVVPRPTTPVATPIVPTPSPSCYPARETKRSASATSANSIAHTQSHCRCGCPRKSNSRLTTTRNFRNCRCASRFQLADSRSAR